MAKLAWIDFINAHPGAHVVVGASEEDSNGSDLRIVASRLGRLIAGQDVAGDYAVGIVREAGAPEVFCAFQQQDAADRFAESVRAKPTDRQAGWASRRDFSIDDAMERLEAVPRPSRRSGRHK